MTAEFPAPPRQELPVVSSICRKNKRVRLWRTEIVRSETGPQVPQQTTKYSVVQHTSALKRPDMLFLEKFYRDITMVLVANRPVYNVDEPFAKTTNFKTQCLNPFLVGDMA